MKVIVRDVIKILKKKCQVHTKEFIITSMIHDNISLIKYLFRWYTVYGREYGTAVCITSPRPPLSRAYILQPLRIAQEAHLVNVRDTCAHVA